MKLMKKAILPLTLSLGLFSNAALADQFTGYAVEVLTGANQSTTFNTALVGMSSTDGGTVEQYIFTNDSDYVNMVVTARANHEVVTVAHGSGTMLGVYYQ